MNIEKYTKIKTLADAIRKDVNPATEKGYNAAGVIATEVVLCIATLKAEIAKLEVEIAILKAKVSEQD